MAYYSSLPYNSSDATWTTSPPAPPGGGGKKPPNPYADPWDTPITGVGDPSMDPAKAPQPSWGYDNGGSQSQPYNPYQPPGQFDWTTDYTNGVFSHPGYDEQWYQDHASDYDQPSNAEQYWNSQNGKYAAGPERATGAKNGYDEWFSGLGTPGFTAAGAGTSHGSNYGGDAYGQRDNGASRSETFADSGGPTFSNYGAGAYGRGANDTTFDTGAAFDRFFDPLSEQSNSEKLYGQDPGLGAYYDRASETGTEKIRNSMAARGLFGSGAAIDEERQLAGDLGADRAKNEANYKLQAAGQSDAERRARMGLAGTLASAADTTSLGRSANERNWAGMLDDTELGQTQERRAGREFADTFGANRDTRNLNWADMLDRNSLARSAEDRGWATAADADRINRSGEARSWSDMLDKETNDNNKSALDYLTAGGNAAGAADAGKYGRLADQRTGAVTAQNSMTKRYTDQFNNLMDMAKTKAGLVSGAVDSATKQKIDTVISTLKAKLAAASNGSNQTQADADEIEGMLGTLTSLIQALK